MDLIIQSVFCEVVKNARFNLPVLIYILINTASDFSTIHFRLNKTDVLEVEYS